MAEGRGGASMRGMSTPIVVGLDTDRAPLFAAERLARTPARRELDALVGDVDAERMVRGIP
jgi:hypothetical protein